MDLIVEELEGGIHTGDDGLVLQESGNLLGDCLTL